MGHGRWRMVSAGKQPGAAGKHKRPQRRPERRRRVPEVIQLIPDLRTAALLSSRLANRSPASPEPHIHRYRSPASPEPHIHRRWARLQESSERGRRLVRRQAALLQKLVACGAGQACWSN